MELPRAASGSKELISCAGAISTCTVVVGKSGDVALDCAKVSDAYRKIQQSADPPKNVFSPSFTISPSFPVIRALIMLTNARTTISRDLISEGALKQACDQSPSFPVKTVTEAFGRIYLVLALPVMVERAAGPSGSAVPPSMLECH